MIAIFDLDGTLVDSDEALAAAYVALGVPHEQVTFGHVLADECARLGLEVADYMAAYDPTLVTPFDGVPELIATLDRWAVCSNKVGPAGRAELASLGWAPTVALFADAFDGPKRLGPVLDAIGCQPADCIYVGDTEHDAEAAADAGVTFAVAGWNPRARDVRGDVLLAVPSDVVGLLDGSRLGRG